MSVKKSALGKGLEALIPDIDISNKNSIIEIDINQIEPNSDQPRKKFDEEKLIQLSESIKEYGIVQPVILIKEESNYKIVAGERRWRAARIAGIKKIPAVIKQLTQNEIMEISLIENLQREDLNPIEEAIAYKKLMDEFKLTQEEISKRIGKSRSAIANTIRLINLDERVKNYVIDEILTEGHARAIIIITDSNIQYEIAKKVIDENLNVRQTEKLVKSLLNNKKQNKVKKEEPYLNEMQERLKNILGTKVSIKYGRSKGKIEIEYYSNDDLERIIDMFN